MFCHQHPDTNEDIQSFYSSAACLLTFPFYFYFIFYHKSANEEMDIHYTNQISTAVIHATHLELKRSVNILQVTCQSRQRNLAWCS